MCYCVKPFLNKPLYDLNEKCLNIYCFYNTDFLPITVRVVVGATQLAKYMERLFALVQTIRIMVRPPLNPAV